MAAKQERGDVHVSSKHQHQSSHHHQHQDHHHPHHATGSNEGGGTCSVSGSAGSAASASRLKSEPEGSPVPGGLSCMSSARCEEGCGGRENGRGSGGTGGQVSRSMHMQNPAGNCPSFTQHHDPFSAWHARISCSEGLGRFVSRVWQFPNDAISASVVTPRCTRRTSIQMIVQRSVVRWVACIVDEYTTGGPILRK